MNHDTKTVELLISDVVPALSQVIDAAGVKLAQARRAEPHSRDIEQARQHILFALLDLVSMSEYDHSEDHLWGICTPADLRDARVVAEFFELPTGNEQGRAVQHG